MQDNETMKVKGKIVSCDFGKIKKTGTPYVSIEFEYINPQTGNENTVYYNGFLSEKAKPYTLERLQKIGLRNSLNSYADLIAFMNMEAGLETEGLNITIETDEYKGKKRKKVKSFWIKKEKTDAEKKSMAMEVYNFLHKKAPVGKAAAPAAKPDPKPESNPPADLFNDKEQIPNNWEGQVKTSDGDLPF